MVEIHLGGGGGVGGEVSEGRAAVVGCHGDRPSCRTTRSRLSAVTVALDHENGRVMGRVGDSASPLRFGAGTVPVQAGRKPPRGSRNSSRAKVGRRLLLRQAEPVSAPIGRLVSGVSRTTDQARRLVSFSAPLRLRGSPPGGAANSRSPSVTRLDRRRLGPPRSAQGPRGRYQNPPAVP